MKAWPAALVFIACGAPATPAATATIAAPATTHAPEPPFVGIEHPRFATREAGRMWIFGAGLTPFTTAKLPIGGTLRVHFATCDFDRTHAVARGHCQAVTRAAFEKIDWRPNPSPADWAFWKWARDHMTIVDAPLAPNVARAYAVAHAGRANPQLGPELLVTSEKTTTLVDDKVLIGGGDEALPISRATGRRVPRVEHVASIVLGESAIPSSVLEDEYPLAASLVGSGAAHTSAEFIVVASEPEHHDAITDALEAAYRSPTSWASTLAMLETTKQDHRDVRIALLVDRALIAWWLRDGAALRRATTALDTALGGGDPEAPAVKTVVDRLLPSLHQLRDQPAVSIVMPADLEHWR